MTVHSTLGKEFCLPKLVHQNLLKLLNLGSFHKHSIKQPLRQHFTQKSRISRHDCTLTFQTLFPVLSFVAVAAVPSTFSTRLPELGGES